MSMFLQLFILFLIKKLLENLREFLLKETGLFTNQPKLKNKAGL
jgi:hypothetical protein